MSETPDVEAEVVDLGPETLPEKIKREIVQAEFDAERAMEMLEYQVAALKRLRPAALAELHPRDFVQMGQTVYLQNVGSQRVAPLLGMVYPTELAPKHEKVDLGDGNYAILFRGWVGSRTLRTTAYVVGGRSSDDAFFDKFDEDGRRMPPKYMDVFKAAWTNWENRAVSGLLGLRGLSIDGLKDLGFKKAGEIQAVQFQKGAKGGGAGNEIPPFGQQFKDLWGKAWTEATPDALKFYRDCFKRDLADDAKKRYHAKTKKQLDALMAEIERRRGAAKEEKKS